MFTAGRIKDDCGFAICDDEDRRIDVFPPIEGRPEHGGPTVHLFSGPFLSPDEAREYVKLLEAAADHADTLWQTLVRTRETIDHTPSRR